MTIDPLNIRSFLWADPLKRVLSHLVASLGPRSYLGVTKFTAHIHARCTGLLARLKALGLRCSFLQLSTERLV